MAVYRGKLNKQAYETKPFQLIDSGLVRGRLVYMYDEIDISTIAAGLKATDVIELGTRLPAGARLVDAYLVKPKDDTGSCKLSTDESTPTDIIAAATSTSAITRDYASAAIVGHKFDKEVGLRLVAAINYTGSAGYLKIGVTYILD